jgi:hypothetical protein
LVRGPVANDRGMIFVVGQDFVRIDPLTLERTTIGTLSGAAVTINSATIIDIPPGVSNAVLLDTSMAKELRTFPGGQYLRDVIPWPQSANWSNVAGHFLSATATVVAVRDNEGNINLIQPDTGVVVQSFPNVPLQKFEQVTIRSAAGMDSVIGVAGQYGEQFVVDGFAPWSSASIGSISDGFVATAAPVDWAAGEHDIAAMWDYSLRVFDPATMAVRYEELHPYTAMFPFEARLFAVDADGDGLQEVFWFNYEGLAFLPHNGPSRNLQTPSRGFRVAGIAGNTLVTTQTSGTFGDETFEIVFRDARTLEVTSRRPTEALDDDSQVLTGTLPANPVHAYDPAHRRRRRGRRHAAVGARQRVPVP